MATTRGWVARAARVSRSGSVMVPAPWGWTPMAAQIPGYLPVVSITWRASPRPVATLMIKATPASRARPTTAA